MKLKFLIVLLTLIVLPLTGFAQKNNVKLGISDLPFKRIGLQYERGLTDYISAQAAINFQLKRSLVPSFLTNNYEFFSAGSDLTQKGFSFIPEIRFYSKKKVVPEGSYLAIQGKYQQSKYDFSKFTIGNETTFLTGEQNFAGIGFQIGKQWVIANTITIDLYYAGLNIGVLNASATITSENENITYEKLADNLNDILDDYLFIDKLFNISAEGNSLKLGAKSIASMPKIGISFGYTF